MKTRLLMLVAVFCVLGFQNSEAASLTYKPSPYKGTDVWLSSYYSYGDDYGVDNDRLRVGGWGDWYYSAIKFDLEGLPQSATQTVLSLYAFNPSDGSTPISSNVWQLTNSWNESSGTYNTSWLGYNLGSLPAPTYGVFNGIIITSLYNTWKSTPSTNLGIMLVPTANSNNFNTYYSSDYSSRDYRPVIQVVYNETVTPPSFKLPLPGNRSWVVTTEIGGQDAKNPGSIDEWHTNVNNGFFSIDFGPASIPSYSGDIPILASAGGKVVESGFTSGNGNYVFVNHSGGNDRNTGFVTNYLHFKYPPSVSVGSPVSQGSVLGYMGNTGISTGTHLHFCVYYNGQSTSTIQALTFIKLDGICMKQYQTEVDGSGNRVANSYWPSTNTP